MAEALKRGGDRSLSGVSKRGVSQVVRQGDGLRECLICVQSRGNSPGDLRDFDRMV